MCTILEHDKDIQLGRRMKGNVSNQRINGRELLFSIYKEIDFKLYVLRKVTIWKGSLEKSAPESRLTD